MEKSWETWHYQELRDTRTEIIHKPRGRRGCASARSLPIIIKREHTAFSGQT